MLSRIRFVAMILLACTILGDAASAFGHGASGYHPNGGNAVKHSNNDHFRPDSGRLQSSYNGPFGSPWNYGGYLGYGYGYPYAYPGWAYEWEGVPYFAQFPPVYYGYEDNMPVVKPSVRTSWSGGVAPQSAADFSEPAAPPRPLRIINPYYYETKTENPSPPKPDQSLSGKNSSGQDRENR